MATTLQLTSTRDHRHDQQSTSLSTTLSTTLSPTLPTTKFSFLENLPPELFSKVLDNLSPTDSFTLIRPDATKPVVNHDLFASRRGLASLSRTCRGFHNEASDALFRVVAVESHRDLLLLFRTLATVPAIRPRVRCFAWLGDFSYIDPECQAYEKHLGSSSYAKLDQDLRRQTLDCWASLQAQSSWPNNDHDALIARLMHLRGPETLLPWNLLGAVLGMIPQVKQLFMTMGCVLQPSLVPETGRRTSHLATPEADCLRRLLDTRAYTIRDGEAFAQSKPPSGLPGSWFAGGSDSFLQELETIVMEPYGLKLHAFARSPFMRSLLLTAPKVKRIELKMWLSWQAIGGTSTSDCSRAVADNVRDVVTFSDGAPQKDMPLLGQTFPKLSTFQVEYEKGFTEAKTTPSGLGDWWETRKALAGVKDTLRTLHLTTKPGNSWNEDPTYPSLLYPGIEQMSVLQDFKVEASWIFGRENPTIAYRVASMLPSSLATFHLIDFWGIADPERFYPDFPNGETPLEFLDKTMSTLCEGCPTHLVNLKDIVISSKLFSPLRAEGPGSTITAEEAEAFVEKHRRSFGKYGRRFAVVAPPKFTHVPESSWARVL